MPNSTCQTKWRLKKHKGKTIEEIALVDKSYLQWAITKIAGSLTGDEIVEIMRVLDNQPAIERPEGYENMTRDEKFTHLLLHWND